MKLATIQQGDHKQVGIVEGEQVFLLPLQSFPSIEYIIQGGKNLLSEILARKTSFPQKRVFEVKLKAPLSNPGKIIGIGLNYRDHCREQNVPIPERPVVFAKFSSSIIGTGEDIRWSVEVTQQVDFEVELGVVIGKTARNVAPQEALNFVFGYTIVNDVSARDIQFRDRQWVRAKSLDTFCPMGPWIVTSDEIPDPQRLHLSTKLNGVTMQDSSTSEMVFSVAELISFLSHSFTLQPGDVIATGTPDGVGVFRKPPVFLKDGDFLHMEIEDIGVLENTCRTNL